MVRKIEVIISGGSGFLGTYMVRRLLKDGHSVRIIDRLRPACDVEKYVTHYNVDDLSNLHCFKPYMFKDVDVVFHLAARLPIERCPLSVYRKVNVTGTDNMLMMSLMSNVPKFIHISSSAVYGVPICPTNEESLRKPVENYGISKYEAELVCEKYRNSTDLDVSMIRPRAILGKERLGAFYLLFLSMKNNRPLYTIGDGTNKVQLVSVNDLVDLLILLMNNNNKNEDFNAGTDKFSTLNDDIGRDLVSRIGSKSRMLYLPSSLGKNLCRILTNIAPIAEWHYELLDKDFYFDISKAKNMLGWKPKDSNVDMLYDAYQSYINANICGELSVHKSPAKSYIVKLLAGT